RIKVALADDEPLFRKGIALLLKSSPDIEVVFEAGNGEEMVTWLGEANALPDVIIMDLKMPFLNGVEATRIIPDTYPDLKTRALTSYHTRFFIANMIEVGAASYLVNNCDPGELLTAIHEVYKAGFYYTADLLEIINECFVPAQRKPRSRFIQEELTKREIE